MSYTLDGRFLPNGILKQELFMPPSPHVGISLDGVEVFTNSSGSHHELRKLDT